MYRTEPPMECNLRFTPGCDFSIGRDGQGQCPDLRRVGKLTLRRGVSAAFAYAVSPECAEAGMPGLVSDEVRRRDHYGYLSHLRSPCSQPSGRRRGFGLRACSAQDQGMETSPGVF